MDTWDAEFERALTSFEPGIPIDDQVLDELPSIDDRSSTLPWG